MTKQARDWLWVFVLIGGGLIFVLSLEKWAPPAVIGGFYIGVGVLLLLGTFLRSHHAHGAAATPAGRFGFTAMGAGAVLTGIRTLRPELQWPVTLSTFTTLGSLALVWAVWRSKEQA